MITRTIMAVILAVAATMTGPAPVTATAGHTATLPADRDAFVTEESPRWSCLTDGNRLCARFHGPTT